MSRIRSRALLVVGLSSWMLTSLAIADATLATTTPPDEASATAPPPEASSNDDLDALLVDALGEQDGGIAVLSIRDGTTTSAVVGNANTAGDPIAADTPFRVGSISKPFIATIVLQLVDEGSVDLDEPLSTVPARHSRSAATFRSGCLLSHRSGLPNYTDQSAFIHRRDRRPGPSVHSRRDPCLHRRHTVKRRARSAASPTRTPTTSCWASSSSGSPGTDLDTAVRHADQRTTRARGHPLRQPSRPPTPIGLAGAVVILGVSTVTPTAAYDSIASAAWAAGCAHLDDRRVAPPSSTPCSPASWSATTPRSTT